MLRTALRALPADRVWVNPDCGLKTRTYGRSRRHWPTWSPRPAVFAKPPRSRPP